MIILDKVKELKQEIDAFSATTKDKVEEFRLKFISKKGAVSVLFEDMKNTPADMKKEAGRILNELKQLAEAKFKTLSEGIETNADAATDIDLTLPPIANKAGNLHPLTLTRLRIIEVFVSGSINAHGGRKQIDRPQ